MLELASALQVHLTADSSDEETPQRAKALRAPAPPSGGGVGCEVFGARLGWDTALRLPERSAAAPLLLLLLLLVLLNHTLPRPLCPVSFAVCAKQDMCLCVQTSPSAKTCSGRSDPAVHPLSAISWMLMLARGLFGQFSVLG